MESSEIAELIVKVRADIAELKATLGESKNELQKFRQQSGGIFSQLGKELAAAFAIGKIKDFVVGSIQEFAKLQRSTDQLRNAVNRSGESWEKHSRALKAYIDDAEETTRFNDDELSESLANLVNKTGDVSIAMNLHRKAMDLAVATGGDLKDTSNTLALAFQGNERGAMQLARAMGITGEKAKDTAFLLDQVDKKFGGFARGEDNLAQDLKLFSTEWGNLKEEMLESFLPALTEILRVARDFVRAAREAWTWWSELFGVYKEGTKDLDGVAKELTRIDARMGQIQRSRELDVQSLKDAAGPMKSFWLTRIQALDAESKRLTDKRAHLQKILRGEVSDLKEAENDKTKAVAKGNKDRLDAEEDRRRKELEAERELKRQLKQLEEERRQLSEDIANQVSGAFQDAIGEMVAAFKEGNLTVEKSFEILGKAILKSIVKALGEALVQLGVKYNVEAFAALATGIGAPAAPGLFAAGGIAAAAGGSMIGLAEAALADGAVVTQPRTVLVGEGGEPEGIFPLSKAKQFGFGGGATNMSVAINLPNVRRPEDFATPGARRVISRELMGQIQRMKDLNGLRLNAGVS